MRYFHVFILLALAVTVMGCSVLPGAQVTQVAQATATSAPVVEEEETNPPTPVPTYTPYPTATPYPTYTPYPTNTPEPSPTLTATPEVTTTEELTPTLTPTVDPTATPSPEPTEEASVAAPPAPPAAPESPIRVTENPEPIVLERLKDADPGPPFTILVSTVRAGELSTYEITGIVRNDSDQTYEGIGVVATFFDNQGFRHGPVEAKCACLFLQPGATCPFSVRVVARNLTAYALHPNGRPSENRAPGPIEVRVQSVAGDGIGNVRIIGLAVNPNEYKVKNVTVSGTLLDASGQIISHGSTLVLGEVAPGGNVTFDLRIPHKPYARYDIYALAERVW